MDLTPSFIYYVGVTGDIGWSNLYSIYTKVTKRKEEPTYV